MQTKLVFLHAITHLLSLTILNNKFKIFDQNMLIINYYFYNE